jgi:hypothetical protein
MFVATHRPDKTIVAAHKLDNSGEIPTTIRVHICVDPYDAASSWPGAGGVFGGNSMKQPLPETGCITALKEEVRIVQLSKGFRAAAKATPGETGPA